MIDTKAVKDRRTLRFNSFDEIRRDLDALEAAHRGGTLRKTGNWTPGMIFTHIAGFINYSYDGYPPGFGDPPWFVKIIVGKFMKKKFIHGTMPVGVKIPRVPNGTVGAEDVSFDAGVAALRGALDRMQKSAPPAPSPMFGPMTHEEWMGLNRRHAELHLSFLHPK